MTHRHALSELAQVGTAWRSHFGHRASEVAAFEAWLDASGAMRADQSARLYLDYRAWSGPIERLPKKRQFLRGGFAKQRFAWRRAIRARQDPLTTFSLFIKHLLEPLRVYRGEGRQDQPHHHICQRQVLGQGGVQRDLVGGHLNLSCGLQPGADAESRAGETSPATKPEVQP